MTIQEKAQMAFRLMREVQLEARARQDENEASRGRINSEFVLSEETVDEYVEAVRHIPLMGEAAYSIENKVLMWEGEILDLLRAK